MCTTQPRTPTGCAWSVAESADFTDPTLRRTHAEAILRAAVLAADPAALVKRALAGATELAGVSRIHVIGIGKAALPMTRTALQELGDRAISSLVVAPRGAAADVPGVMHGGHPLPDQNSVEAGKAVLASLRSCEPDDLLLVLLSGGGSAVVALPLPGISIDEYADCVLQLMRSGADIEELNTVRKHIDDLKGGRMAVHADGATILCLTLSDVIGDAPETIASGPFSPDPTTCADALDVLRRYDLLDSCAASIRQALERGSPETPAAGDVAFDSVRVRIIGGNDIAVAGAASHAAELGYAVHRAPLPVTGFAREAGVTLARQARMLQKAEPEPLCVVAGGETTVSVTGAGRGGRNQEIVLAACLELDGSPGITVGSIGTDGVDGWTDAAGAIADEETLRAATAAGVDPAAALQDNDSYTFFHRAGGLVITGPTGTNVNDVQIALATPDLLPTLDDQPTRQNPPRP
jgi:glycerate 2-kinase